MTRFCKKCGVEKILHDLNFRPNGHAAGFRNACRECEKNTQAARYAADPEKVCAASRKWAAEHREQHNATKRKWVRNNLDKHNATRRKSTYGISDSEFKALFVSQGGKCALCDFVFPGMQTGDRNLSPHVDHCHDTGKIRGLLCNSCNTGIGRFKDSTDLLQKAIWYLLRTSE